MLIRWAIVESISSLGRLNLRQRKKWKGASNWPNSGCRERETNSDLSGLVFASLTAGLPFDQNC